MPSTQDAKSMAKSLRNALAERQVALPYGACLEIVARQFGFADWNTLAAKFPSGQGTETPKHLCCSFCGKNPTEVRALVEGGCTRPRDGGRCVFICDECIALCATVTADAIDSPRGLSDSR